MSAEVPRSSAPPVASVRSGAREAPRVWRPTFQGVLLGITAVLHASGAAAWWHAARAWQLPQAGGLAVVASLALALAFRPIVLDTFPDKPRSPWRVWLIELPYFAHWCALLPTLLTWLVALPIGAAQTLVGDPSPASPGAWAWRAYLAGLALSSWGIFVNRMRLKTRRVGVRLRGLPGAFDGFRIVQLSDLHVGTFTSWRMTRNWIRHANGLGADLVVVTGDLVSGGVAFHDRIARLVGMLRAPEGVAVVPGNHDYFGDGQPLFGLLEDAGVRVLRNASFFIERRGSRLMVGGVDDAWTGRSDLAQAMAERERGVPVVLLAHDPALFATAAAHGIELVLSGHTHGGQVAMPLLARWVNLSAWAHRYRLGVYREGNSTLVVSAGLGTTGPPIRLGVMPEVVLIELRAADP